MRFQNKVAIVTGATREAGITIARRFAAEGAAVACLGRTEKRGEAAAKSIRDAGGRAIFIRTDVSREDSVRAAVAGTLDAFGRIDIVVNHAAAQDVLRDTGESRVTEEPTAVFDSILKVNLYGVFWMAKYALPAMIRNGAGVFLSVSSVNSVRVPPSMPAYVASKAGLEGLTRQIANDYGAERIRANAIGLGSLYHEMSAAILDDPRQSGPRKQASMVADPATPDELAGLLMFLASDEAATSPGQ